MPEATPTSSSRSSYLPLAGILVLAAILRLIFLDARSFWSDEIVSVKLATDNWGGFWYWISSREANMALYYLLLRGWVKAGDGETWVRLFSALLGIATVPLFYALAKRLYHQRVALISALLAATSASLVQFSQEARSYSLLILLCVASYYFFVRFIQEDKIWLVLAYILVSAAALYAHFFAALVICSQAVSLLWLPRRTIRAGRVAIAWTLVALAALPITFYVLKRDVGQLYWVQPTTLAEVYKLTVFFAGGSKAVAAVLSLLSLVAIGIAIAGHRQQLRTRSEASWRYAVPLLWAVVPVVLTILASLHKPLFVHRYLLVALPGYLIMIGLGLASIRDQKRLWSAMIVFVGLSSVSIAQGYHRAVEDWRGVVDHVLSRTQPHDTILIYIPYGANDFFFYAERRERRGSRIQSVRIDAAQSVAQLESIDSPRAWLLLYPSPHVAEDASLFERTLTERYASVERKQFKGVEVLLFSQPLKQPPYRPPAASAPRP